MDENTAYNMGWMSYELDLSRNSNPFEEGSILYNACDRGWCDAERLVGDFW